jgi:hypothetical protein
VRDRTGTDGVEQWWTGGWNMSKMSRYGHCGNYGEGYETCFDFFVDIHERNPIVYF